VEKLFERWNKFLAEANISQMFHSALEKNLSKIKANGLQVGSATNLTLAGSWADEFYKTRPIYLSLKKGKFEGSPLLVNTRGLDLVADLPSLVDTGAYIEEDSMWWKEGEEPKYLLPFMEDGEIFIDEFLVPNSSIVAAAIKTTNTAVSLTDISPDRIRYINS